MPAERRAGMDHELYRYSALPRRPPLRWPNGARVAFWIALNVERWELAPPPGTKRPPGIAGSWETHFPDYRTFSHREYGNRIGIFRVLDALDRHALRATVALNAAMCEGYGVLIDALRARGYEFAAHGRYATRMIASHMPEDEERAEIATSLTAVRDAAGAPVRGWIGQDSNESARTIRLLAGHGLQYVADWPNDDQPYRFETPTPLVALPRQLEWDDQTLLWQRQVATPQYPQIVADALQTLEREGAQTARVFGLSLHPWLIGQPHRIRYLIEALERVCEREGIWYATASEIADAYLAATEPAASPGALQP